MSQLQMLLNTFGSDESGQDLVEYGLIAGFVGLAALAALGSLATSLVASLENIAQAWTNS